MDPNADIPTSLDNLRTLHINSDLPLDAFFDSFAFPALSIISISNSPNEYEEHREFAAPDWTQPSFLNLLQRSKAPLKCLRLAVTMSESDLIECLACVGGTLQVLAVESVDRIPFLTGEAARFMSHHIDAGVVTCTCPKLEQIHFGRNIVMPLANDVLGNLAESRWSDEGHLSHRQWCSPNLTAFQWEVEQGVVPPADIRRLAKLKQAGMPISSGYLHDLFDS
ncbi:hypothetical protein FIBSPDRAFT_1054580 [Athelia psychrophila]|uniref:F-box domain-containing protein n=1 Tax=Athelia psychrophila TaxID=1759441 RepID=A0A167V356_9AGAM|nr:hypothetical protein FIBSPDRAFT_1054580 [Fibularhizoctonia sp. CBS 109695]